MDEGAVLLLLVEGADLLLLEGAGLLLVERAGLLVNAGLRDFVICHAAGDEEKRRRDATRRCFPDEDRAAAMDTSTLSRTRVKRILMETGAET